MGFFDLNIPYNESDRYVTDKSSLTIRRLKLALKAMELGYTGVAYNRTLKGVMSESHRCSTPLFSLSKLNPSSSSFFAAVEFHRRLLNVAVSSPFRQYTRLTVVVDIPSQASALNSGNPILKSYDVIAVRPMNQNAFDQACRTSEVDIIAIDFTEKLPFRLKQIMVKAAIKRGVYFEITYLGLIVDAQSRRQMISNCKLLVDWTRGKNLIFSSAALTATELRGPLDVANLFSLLGLPMEHAKAAISKNCRSLLANALRKTNFYKEAVRVEEVPNRREPSFEDWLKWDPISSGEGDLLLDEMKKSFSMSQTTITKKIDFTSAMNGLPAHGLQIKDLIKPSMEPPGIGNYCTPSSMETEEDDPNPMPMPENQGSLDALSKEQRNCKNSEVSLASLSTEGGETRFIDAKIRYEASDFQNSEGTIPKDSTEGLHYSSDLEANLVETETQIQVTNSQKCVDSEQVLVSTVRAESTTPISSVELSNSLNKASFSELQLEESNVKNRCEIDIFAPEGLAMVEVPNITDGGNEKRTMSFGTSGAFSLDVYVEGEQQQCSEMTNSSVTLPLEELLNLKTNLNEPASENTMMVQNEKIDIVASNRSIGRGKRKRNSLHQPLLFPFKRFLNPRPFKRKAR
ncbi:hypothetical protein RD792_002805, partial [Penstemon davidsonii]